MIFDQSSRKSVIVKSGLVISTFLTEEGKQKSIELYKPGTFLRMDNSYSDNSTEQYVYLVALIPTTLCVLSNTVFESLHKTSPGFSNAVYRAINNRLKENLNYLLHLKTDSSEGKVSYILSFLKEADIDYSILTHEDIALLTDLNRVTVTRAIKNINRQKESG
jgi:CRP-like cAMP-binding protein